MFFFDFDSIPFTLLSLLLVWLIIVRFQRYQRQHLHAQLENDLTFDDMETIVKHLHLYEFPWLLKTQLDIGTLQMFSVPSISSILCNSRILQEVPKSRNYDTHRVVRRFYENGLNSTVGRATMKRLNEVHGKHKPIQNIDMVYGMAALVAGPIQAISKYGWRKLLPVEEEAIFQYWVGHPESVGRRMHIENLPESIEELYAFVRKYEAVKVEYAPSNETIAAASFGSAISTYPKLIHPLLNRMIATRIDEKFQNALKLPTPFDRDYMLVESLLHSSAWMCKWLLLPRTAPAMY